MADSLDANLIIAASDAIERALRDYARWIASRHPEWDAELISYLTPKLSSPPSGGEQTQLIDLLAKLTKSTAIQQLLADAVRHASRSEAGAKLALAAMAASGQKELPPAWL